MGDLSGYTLTLSAMETLPANFVASITSADPLVNGMSSANYKVTVGTNSLIIRFTLYKRGMLYVSLFYANNLLYIYYL